MIAFEAIEIINTCSDRLKTDLEDGFGRVIPWDLSDVRKSRWRSVCWSGNTSE